MDLTLPIARPFKALRFKKSWFRVNIQVLGSKKTKEEKLLMLVEDLSNELFNDTFEGNNLTSQEIYFVVSGLKETVKDRLIKKAEYHSQEANFASEAAKKL